jgi:hypothetical protein
VYSVQKRRLSERLLLSEANLAGIMLYCIICHAFCKIECMHLKVLASCDGLPFGKPFVQNMCKENIRVQIANFPTNVSTASNIVSYSEVVITLDFESSIPGSNPGKRILLAFFKHQNALTLLLCHHTPCDTLRVLGSIYGTPTPPCRHALHSKLQSTINAPGV